MWSRSPLGKPSRRECPGKAVSVRLDSRRLGPARELVAVAAGKVSVRGMRRTVETDPWRRARVPDKDRLRGPGGDKVAAWGAVWDPVWDPVWDVVRGTEGVLVGVGDEVAVAVWVEADEGRDYKEQFSQHGSWTAAVPSITASRTCGVTFSLCTSYWLSRGLRSALGN